MQVKSKLCKYVSPADYYVPDNYFKIIDDNKDCNSDNNGSINKESPVNSIFNSPNHNFNANNDDSNKYNNDKYCGCSLCNDMLMMRNRL